MSAATTTPFDGDIAISRKTKTSNFTMLENALLRNKALSFKARGILAHLLSHAEGWRIRMAELINSSPDGETAIRSGVAELIAAGYMTREVIRNENRSRILGWQYRVFEEPVTTLGFSTSSNSTSRKSRPKNTNDPKKNIAKNTEESADTSLRSVSAAKPAGFDGQEEGRIDEQELADYNAACEAIDSGNAEGVVSIQPGLELTGEEEQGGKQFPWRQITGAVLRILPQLQFRMRADRRDFRMKQFWRKHGKTVGSFEVLARKVSESDFLMARNGHKGQHDGGKPYPWAWIFDVGNDGLLRAEKIMNDDYSNERMAFVLEKRKEKKLTKVKMATSSDPVMVDMDEQWNGEPRYRAYGTVNGLPDVVDLKV